MVPIKISYKLDGLVMKVGGKVKWQKVGFKFKKLRQGETVPLWDEPLPRARPDFPQRNTLFSFKMKLNIWELLKFPLFHPCHHVSSIFISNNTLSGSGTRSPRRTPCPRRLSPCYSPISTPSMSSTLRFSRWFCCHCLFHCHRNCLCYCHIFFVIAISIAIATGIAIIIAIVIAIANSFYEYQPTFLWLGNLRRLLSLKYSSWSALLDHPWPLLTVFCLVGSPKNRILSNTWLNK